MARWNLLKRWQKIGICAGVFTAIGFAVNMVFAWAGAGYKSLENIIVKTEYKYFDTLHKPIISDAENIKKNVDDTKSDIKYIRAIIDEMATSDQKVRAKNKINNDKLWKVK
jgi:hypothetical protein